MTKTPLKPRRRNRQMVVANNRPGTLFNLDNPEPVTLSEGQTAPTKNSGGRKNIQRKNKKRK